MPDLIQQRIQNVLSLRRLSASAETAASHEQAGTLAARLQILEDAISVSNGAVTIKTGSASISLKKDGSVVVSGKDVTVKAFGKASIRADGEVVIKGTKISQN